MSKPTFLLFPFGLASVDAKIGRLVSNPFSPGEAYIPETPSIPNELISQKIITNVDHVISSIKEKNIQISLANFLKFNYEASNEVNTQYTSLCIRTSFLRNAENELPKILAEESTKEWIRKKRSERVYLIVGIKVFEENATVSVQSRPEAKLSASLEIPATAVIGAAAGAPGLPGVATALDVSIDALVSHKDRAEAKFTTSGETIFAIAYRELKTRRTFLRGYDFKAPELKYASVPAGEPGIYYARSREYDVRMESSDDVAPTESSDDTEVSTFELRNEDSWPLVDDMVVEKGEEIWLMKTGP